MPETIEKSLALNIYVDKPKLGDIEEDVKQKLLKKGIPNNNVKVKVYTDGVCKYFPINIFRFISKKEEYLKSRCFSKLYEEIKKINKDLDSNPIPFEIREFTPVISDPYLANDNPLFDP